MAKKKNRASQKGKRTKSNTPQRSNAAKALSRRSMLQYGLAGGAVLAGGGYFGIRAVEAAICETDLTKIGNGTPAVVQIHDPNCPICTSLQREARKAIKAMDGEQPEFLVANIKTLEGSTFAANHGVPHVTILLMSGAGDVVEVLQGPRQRDELQGAFEALMRRG